MKISLVIKRNMIICKYELKLSNPTTLAIAILLSFEILHVSYFLSKIRRKVLIPFKCLKFVKSYIQFSFTTRHIPNILLNQTIPIKKPLNNRFEDTEMTVGGSYSMWNFLE